MVCVFCESCSCREEMIKDIHYCFCPDCGGWQRMKVSLLSKEEQRKRYMMHNNNPEDEGYMKFLKGFLDPVLEELDRRNYRPLTVLDYGSGPEPALMNLMKSYRKIGRISENAEIRGWDPFFAPDTPFFCDGADLVTCLEVAEHFENPAEDFKKLSSAVKKGGYVAIGTMPVPEPGDLETFSRWWYRSDATHTAFYTLKAVSSLASRVGLCSLGNINQRIFLFKKE